VSEGKSRGISALEGAPGADMAPGILGAVLVYGKEKRREHYLEVAVNDSLVMRVLHGLANRNKQLQAPSAANGARRNSA
jgi:hypothetical protein